MKIGCISRIPPPLLSRIGIHRPLFHPLTPSLGTISTSLVHHHHDSPNFGRAYLYLRCCILVFSESARQASYKYLKKTIRRKSHHHVNAECYTWDTSLTSLKRFFTLINVFLKLCQKENLPFWHYFRTSKKPQTKTSTFATSTIVLNFPSMSMMSLNIVFLEPPTTLTNNTLINDGSLSFLENF